MTEIVGRRLPENLIRPKTEISAELIAVGEKIFGDGVIKLLTRINSILKEVTNLDDGHKSDLKNRIYEMIRQFLEVLASVLKTKAI
jgi:hypothetical protein